MDSPDVEKEFPGLYAAEGSKGKKSENDFSDGDAETSKKDLIKKKDKKDKKSYATLEEKESSEDEKSPSKSKKTKAFKFPSTRSKEKREKSREKEKSSEKELKEVKDVKEKDVVDSKADKKKKEKSKEKEEKKEKSKDKEDKKEKSKDKDKDKKKTKQSSFSANDEVLSLGDVQPIFGVSLGLAVTRSKCHDNVNLPQVVRDCIDYLQENGLNSDQIYRAEALKTRLQQLKKLYNNRENDNNIEFDIPTACSLLKMYLKELNEPILTTDLSTRFEEVATITQPNQQEKELRQLIELLPNCNRVLLAWLIQHFQSVIQHEKQNKLNAQNLAVLLSSTIQMSHRLLITILSYSHTLFEDTKLHKYVPPITAASPNLPETPENIAKELKKQESLLEQIHLEMNAGFVNKKREEQLWETQRIITQLKRKLRSFEKKQDSMQKSMDDIIDDVQIDFTLQTKANSDDESVKTITGLPTESTADTMKTPQEATTVDETSVTNKQVNETHDASGIDKISVSENGFLSLPEDHPEYLNLLRLQIENQELLNWKQQLQSRINQERSEIVRLKRLLNSNNSSSSSNDMTGILLDQDEEQEYERLIAHYLKENALLEQKRIMLTKEIFQERNALVQLEVELGLKQYVH